MDRRQAIKKLAAGTAIASGGSLVLSSRDVAYAMSAPGTGLIGAPGSGDVQHITTWNNPNGTVTLSDTNNPSCSPGAGELERSYSWRINSFNIKGGRTWKFFIRNASDTATIREGAGGFSDPNTTHNTVVLRKTNKPGKLKPLDNGDSYSIEMMVTWKCSEAASSLRYQYRFSATYPNPPTVQFIA